MNKTPGSVVQQTTDKTTKLDNTEDVRETISSSVYVGLSSNGTCTLFEVEPIWNEKSGKYEKRDLETSQRISDTEPIAFCSLVLLAGLSNEPDPGKVFGFLDRGRLFKIDATFTHIKQGE